MSIEYKKRKELLPARLYFMSMKIHHTWWWNGTLIITVRHKSDGQWMPFVCVYSSRRSTVSLWIFKVRILGWKFSKELKCFRIPNYHTRIYVSIEEVDKYRNIIQWLARRSSSLAERKFTCVNTHYVYLNCNCRELFPFYWDNHEAVSILMNCL